MSQIQRKMVLLAVLVAMVLSTANVRAERQRLRQLGRGMTNVVTGVWEIPLNMHLINRDMGGFAGLTYGFLRGFCRFAVREGVGVFEIVTFPMGWQPIIEPEFPDQPTKSTTWRVNKPHVKD